MTDKKISELAAGSVLSGDELVMIVQGGVTKRTTIADIMVGSSTVGGEALAGETNAMGIDFTYHTDITKQHYISDLTTPANNYNSYPQGKLTYTSPALKMTRQSDGVWRYVNHNICRESQTFGTTWTATNNTVTDNSVAAPDGTTTADTITPTSTNGNHRMQAGTSSTSHTSIIMSCFVKPNGYTEVAIREDTTTGAAAVFTLTGGGTVKGTHAAGSITSVTGAISDAGNGWYRISVLFSGTSATTMMPALWILNGSWASGDPAGISFAGDTTSGVYAWGFQEKRYPVNDAGGYTYATGYLVTTANPLYDLPYEWNAALASQGILIEEERTNLALSSQVLENATYWSQSAVTVTANTTVAPDGTTTAETFDITNGPGHRINQDLTLSASTTYTFSFFAKRGTATDVAYSVHDLSHGSDLVAVTSYYSSINSSTWTRVSVTFTTPVGGTSIRVYVLRDGGQTGTVFIWGTQLEVGAFPSSPIHTIAATVTRAVDNISLAGASFPYSTSVGTLVGNAMVPRNPNTATDAGVVVIAKSNYTDRIDLYIKNGTTDIRGKLVDETADKFDKTGATATASVAFKAAIAIATGDNAVVVNNGSAQTDASSFGGIGVDYMNFGGFGPPGAPIQMLNGYLRQVTYLKRRATNGELQTRTT